MAKEYTQEHPAVAIQLAAVLLEKGNYPRLEDVATQYGLVYDPEANSFHQEKDKIGIRPPLHPPESSEQK